MHTATMVHPLRDMHEYVALGSGLETFQLEIGVSSN